MRSDEDFASVIGLLYEAALDPSQWTVFLELPADTLGRRRHEEDIWWRRLPGAVTGECFTGSDLVGTREFLATPLARDVGKTTDVAFILGGWFQKNGELLGLVSVLRGKTSDDFSDDHREHLGRILPHLRRPMGRADALTMP